MTKKQKNIEELEKQIFELNEKIQKLESMEYNEKLMIEQSPDCMIYLDTDFKIVYINKEAINILGYTLHEICSKSVNIISDEIVLTEECNTDNICSLEFNAIKNDGTKFFCEMKISSLYDNDHIKYGYMCILRDISTLQEAKQRLIKSEEKYRKIIENSNDNIIITKDGKLIYLNPAVEKTIGYSNAEGIGTRFTNYLSKEDREKIMKFHEMRLQGVELPRIYEATIIDKWGKRFHMELNNSLIELDGEKCVISFLRDITKRKTQEKEYEDKLRYHKEAMDLAYDGIAILDKDKKFIYANQSYVQMNGLDNYNELIGESWNKLYSDDDINKITDKLKSFKNWRIEINGERQGTKYYQELSVTVLEDGGIIALIRDITKIKNNENKLRIAKEKAEESDKLKSAFLANMSHEIRTPINSIKGFADLINNPKDKLDKSDLKRYTSIIKRRSDELLSLINDILDLSKIEANQMQIQYKNFSLKNIIDDLYYSTLNRLKEKESNVILKKYIPNDDEIIITTDQKRLQQILNNLLDNAVKFTTNGEIEFGYKIINPTLLEFFVKDSGIGIPENKLGMIFERFRQANDDDSLTYGGTGLGLTICKKLLELLGGEIKVFSKENQGTVFTFTIPLNNNIQSSYFDDLSKKQVKQLENINWSDKTIMVVEDDGDNLSLIESMLKHTKVNIIVARDGEQAELIYLNNKDIIDIILMDIRIPKQDGLKTTAKIKSIKNVPIIAQTAFAMKGDEDRMLLFGCDDYISKPIDESLLLSKMDYFFHTNINIDVNKSKNKLKNFFNLKNFLNFTKKIKIWK